MPRIALPRIVSELNSVKVPPAPDDPPTVGDVAKARLFTSNLCNAYDRNEAIDREDIGRAVVYEQQVTAASVNHDDDDNEGNPGAPAWFEAAMQRALAAALTPMQAQLNERMDSLERKVDSLERKVDFLERKVDSLERKVDTLERKVDALERKVDSLERKVDSLERKLDTLQLEGAKTQTMIPTIATLINDSTTLRPQT